MHTFTDDINSSKTVGFAILLLDLELTQTQTPFEESLPIGHVSVWLKLCYYNKLTALQAVTIDKNLYSCY